MVEQLLVVFIENLKKDFHDCLLLQLGMYICWLDSYRVPRKYMRRALYLNVGEK